MAYSLLDAINHVLVAGNETPVTSLTNDSSSAATIVASLLDKERRHALSEGLQFNTRRRAFSPTVTGKIPMGSNVLSVDGWDDNIDNRYTIVDGNLYDVDTQTDIFTKDVKLEVIYEYDFVDMPVWVQYRIMTAVAVHFHVQFSPDQLHLQSLLQIARDALNRCNEKELISHDVDMVRKSPLGAVVTSGLYQRYRSR